MQVFISHAASDAKLARQLADTLRESGFEVWDESQILPGDNWAKSLGKALDESSAMVVLLTPNSAGAPNIAHEVSYALGKLEYKDRLIPVMAAPEEQLEPAGIPWVLKLDRFHTVHVPNLGEDEVGFRQIAQALEAIT